MKITPRRSPSPPLRATPGLVGGRSPIATAMHGVLAAGMLLAFVVGLPFALRVVAPLDLPDRMPELSSVLDSLTRADDGSLLLMVLRLVAWGAWACFAGCVVLEIVSVVGRRPTPRIPLLRLPQQGAASLVAAVVVVLGSTGGTLVAPDGGGGAAPTVTAPPMVAMASIAPADADPPSATEHRRREVVRTGPDELPTVVVRRHDTLWGLAERHLSSGLRYREIVDLNRGREQPDGRRLTDPHWIYPGWVLRLPADATGAGVTRPVKQDGAHRGGERHHVQRPAQVLPPPAATHVDRGPDRPAVVTTGPLSPIDGAASDRPQPSIVATAASGIAVDDAIDPAERAPLVALGLGAITVAGVVAEVGRQRRARQRVRRTGTRIASPSPRGAVAERQLRAVASESPALQVRTAMRLLAAGCARAGREVPRVELVRVGPDSVRLLLAADDRDPVAPFDSCGSRCWQWRAVEGSDPSAWADAGDLPDPCPALLSVGADGPDLVLVNLEAAGALHVVAEPELAGPVLDALTIDLTNRSREESVSLALVTEDLEGDEVLAGAGVAALTDEEAGRVIGARDAQVRDVLHAAAVDDVAQARSAGVGEDVWQPQVVVGRDVTATAEPWSGTAVVTTGAGAGWQLRTDDGDAWRLDPGDVALVPQRLADDAAGSLHDLLDPGPRPIDAEPEGSVSEQRDRLRELLARLEIPEESGAADGPRVLLLGTVEVQGGADDLIPGRVRRAAELVAYLALHPGASRHAVEEAMWPGRRVPRSTRNPFVSRARLWLGRDASGAAYLPLAADEGAYRLLPQVSCDWYDFVRLARRGLREDDPGDFEAALTLVRGRPFLGVDPASYAWADDDAQGIVAAIVDVAHLLSVDRLAGGAPADAARAAARGLLVEPASETLHRDAIRAAAARGDGAEVHRTVLRMRQSFEELDLGEDLMPETLQLIRQLDTRSLPGPA